MRRGASSPGSAHVLLPISTTHSAHQPGSNLTDIGSMVGNCLGAYEKHISYFCTRLLARNEPEYLTLGILSALSGIILGVVSAYLLTTFVFKLGFDVDIILCSAAFAMLRHLGYGL